MTRQWRCFMRSTIQNVIGLHQPGISDIATVGEKNASLGEMTKNLTKLHLKVPPGFATTTASHKEFLIENQINNKIYGRLPALDANNLKSLRKVSGEIQKLILNANFSSSFINTVTKEYNILSKKYHGPLVQGKVNPDEFYVYKPSIPNNKPTFLQRKVGNKAFKVIYDKNSKNTKTVKNTKSMQKQFHIDDVSVAKLARFAIAIEKHYKKPIDIEWAHESK